MAHYPQIQIKDNVVCNTAGTIINAPFSEVRTGEHASGTLNNRGLMNSQNIEVRFLTLNNIGSGQLYGDQIAIAAYAVNNYPECVDGKPATPVLGARQHLAIGAHLMNNREHALLFSLGSMSVGQNLNTQHQLTGKAVELNNYLAKIHIQGSAELNIATLNNEADSTIHAEQQLTLNSDSINGIGSISSAGDLQVTLNGDQPKKLAGSLQAQGNLTLTAPGELNNHNSWEAGEQVTVRCQFLRNHAEGSIRSEGQTQIVVGAAAEGRLNNRGLIDGVTTEIRGHSLNNLGRGVIYGDQLRLGAHTLTNNREQVNTNTKAIIAARQQLTLGAQHILNREGALIMSAGPMAVGERLDEQQQLVGQTLELNNDSATIDVHGDATFNITTLNNRDLHFSTREVQVSHMTGIRLVQPSPQVCRPNDYTEYNYNTTTTETQIATQNPAKLLIASNLILNGQVLNNDKSQVVMGGTLAGCLKTINNINAAGKRIIEDIGSAQWHYSRWHGGFRQCTTYHTDPPAPHHVRSEQAIPLTVAVDRRNHRPAGSGIQIADRAELALQPYAPAEGQLAAFSPPPPISEVMTLARHPSTGQSMVVRSSNTPLSLPTSGLFSIDATATDRPLISTDPRFINHPSGFSTQHLLRELRLTTPLPRSYGDGFYEQQRLRDQVIQLTGQRFLPGYRSDAQQQQALVTQGMAAAQALQLTPGKALTAAQQAQLTTAIVWPVVKPVTLANGQITQVLDPQLYIPLVAYSPGNSGNALIAASTIQLDLSGDLRNSGNIRASNTLALTAENIHNQRGTLHGRANRLKARQDVHNQGGNLGAEQHLQVQAGRDFKLQTATVTSSTISHTPEGPSAYYSNTHLDQRAGVYVLQPQGVLEVAAERDVDLTAARVLNAGVAGRTQFTAGRDITLGAVQVGEQQHITGHYHSINQGHSREVGSQLKTAGDIDFQAGRNFDSTAARVTSGIRVDHPGAPCLTEASSRAIAAAGGSEDSLVAADSTVDATATPPLATGSLRIRAGNHIDIRAGQASYYYQHQWGGSHQDTSENSVLKEESGLAVQAPQGELQIAAAQDLNLSAVQIGNAGAAGKTTLTAGRHLTLGTMNTTQQQSHIQSADNFLKQHRSAEVGTEIQTVGDLQCRAGENFQATASQVSSQQGALQVAAGAQLDIRSGYATQDYDEATKQTKRGFLKKKTIHTRDIRHQTMALGSNFSGRQVEMVAGGRAIGEGKGQITVHGSSVVGDQQTTLIADNVNIISAENRQQQHYAQQVKKSGLFSTGGASLFIGSQHQSATQQQAGVTHHSSTVGSLQGNVTIQAPQHYRQLASQVVAPQGHVEIISPDADILAAHNQLQLTQENHSRSSGLTVGMSNPLESLLQPARQLQAAMNQPSSDSRLQALAATVSNLATQQALEAIRPNLQPLGSDNIHVHFGKRESHRVNQQSYHSAQPSQVAGRTVLIRAPQGHIKVEGSSVLGEQQTALLADRVSIISAEDHQQQQDSQQEKTTGFSASTEGSALRIGGQSQSVQQQQSDILHQGSHVACAQGNLIIQAPQGYRQRASQVVAPQGQLEIHSTKVDILAGINQRQLTQKTSSSSSGLTMGLDNPLEKTLEAAVKQTDNPRLQALALATGGWASKNVLEALQHDPQQLALMKGNASFGNRETHHGRSESYTTAQPSHVFGRTTLISAPQGHIQVEGSSVDSEQRTTLLADSVSVTSAELPQQQRCFQSEEKNGLFPSGPLSTTFGEQESSSQQQRLCTQQHSSIIGSQRGDVHIWAKQHYQQKGSHLLTPQGDGIVSAATLDILDTHNQQQFTQESSSSIDGLTAGVTNPIASALQNAQQLQAAARQSDNPRMQALAIATGGLAVKNLADALKAKPQQLGGLDFSITVGSRESQSNSQQSHSTAHRSQLVARNIILQAREGDVTIQGDLQIAEQAQFTAAGQLKFLASENRGQQQSSQSSSSVSMGIGFGSSGPPAIIVGVSDGDGSGQGASCRYNLAQVNAGQKVVLQSGGDVLMQGEIRAPQIQSKVGGLKIESLQDTDTQQGEQRQFGMEVAIGFKRFSASASVNQNHYRSDFASVRQQAGIKAGDLGFQNEVDGITQIKGGVIASSSKAVKEDRNRHSTAAILYTNLENRADYEAQSFGGSIGFSKESGQSALPAGGEGAGAQGQQGRAGAIPIALNASDSASSTTYSGISGAGQAVTITNQAAQQALTGQTPEQAIAGIDASVTRDQDGSNALAPIFNRQEIEAGFQIVGALTREVGTFLENRVKEQTQAQKALKEEQAKAPAQQDSQKIAQLQQTLQENQTWEMGGKGRILLSALTMAAGGNVTGSTGQLLQATAVNVIQSYGAQQIKLIADSMNSEAARTALQGLLAGAGAAAQGQNATPAALGASASVVLNNLLESAYGEPNQRLTPEERTARKNLVTTLITAATHALGGDAALANAAATLETENNGVGMLPGSKLGLWLSQRSAAEVLTTAQLEGDLAKANLELISYLGGLPVVIAHDATQDIAALQKGETTLEEIARQRGVQYVTGALLGKLAQKGIGIAVQGGRLALAPMASTIQRSAALQQSQKVVYSTLKKLGINLRPITTPTGQRVVIQLKTAKLAETGMQWGKGIEKQGNPWEEYCAKRITAGSRLTPNFKTFDFFDQKTGVAISAKSLDTLTPAKLAKPQQIYSTMKNKMIDPIIDFKKHKLGESTVIAEKILQREIHLAIPKGTRPAQWEQINRAVQYAQDNGIQITITVIKP